MAIREKSNIQSEMNLTRVIVMLDDQDPMIRQSAATYCTVSGLKANAAKAVLMDHLEDSDVKVKISIAEALYHIGEMQCSLRAINEALLDNDPWIRLHALHVLQTFGYDVAPAIRLARRLMTKEIGSSGFN
jgi:HEAT repeat protein